MQLKCTMCNKHTASNMSSPNKRRRPTANAEPVHPFSDNENTVRVIATETVITTSDQAPSSSAETKQLAAASTTPERTTQFEPNQDGGRVYKNCCSHYLLPLGRFCHIPECKEERRTCRHAEAEIERIETIQRRATKTMEIDKQPGGVKAFRKRNSVDIS